MYNPKRETMTRRFFNFAGEPGAEGEQAATEAEGRGRVQDVDVDVDGA